MSETASKPGRPITRGSGRERFCEQLGVRYECALLPVASGESNWVRDVQSGERFPVQSVPAMPIDDTTAATVNLALVTLAPHRELVLEPCEDAAPPPSIEVIQEQSQWIIVNGSRSLRLPASGYYGQPMPGPWLGFRLGERRWFGESRILNAPFLGQIETTVESRGPCCVQWRIEYRWGSASGFVLRARWAAGSDTILVMEDCVEDSGACIEFLPFGKSSAKAFWLGALGRSATQPLHYQLPPGAVAQPGPRLVNWLSHISYFNQWNASWVGFNDDSDDFVGIFAARGGLWRTRGRMRMGIYEDERSGSFMQWPVKCGRRVYGVVLAARKDAGIEPGAPQLILNARKTTHADLSLSKVKHWVLDYALESQQPQLVPAADLASFRERLSANPGIPETLKWLLKNANLPERPWLDRTCMAAAIFTNDAAALKLCLRRLLEHARTALSAYAVGGFDRLGIFDGRAGKAVAYELDVLWASNLIDVSTYRTVRRWLLTQAYMFSDPDYCNFGDFWPKAEPAEFMVEAMKDDIGDTPVPPNFSAEFFSTTGLLAELFPTHPQHNVWRAWALKLADPFNSTFFERDGTYRESLNYHAHCLSELLMYYYPLRLHQVRDFFSEAAVKGAFQTFLDVATPLLSNNIPQSNNLNWPSGIRLVSETPARSILIPANGNSGHGGKEMLPDALALVGAAVYAKSDPELSAQLTELSLASGQVIFGTEHPMLDLLIERPVLPRRALLDRSSWRHGLGVYSRATNKAGAAIWSEFRAGSNTHHMCFDQGHFRLAAWGRMLLADYGYSAKDQDGAPLPVVSTWMHNTIVYSRDKKMTSGYTGLEQAPEPILVHMDNTFDWTVLRIINTNHRIDSYRRIFPVKTTRHVRHYLFVKPSYVLVWDFFEEAHGPSTFWLHPTSPMIQAGANRFVTGRPGEAHLVVQFLHAPAVEVIENQKVGPFWSFGVANGIGLPYLTLLAPQMQDRNIVANFNAASRTVRIQGADLDDEVRLPEPGQAEILPTVIRRRA